MDNFEEFSLVGKDLYMLGLVDSGSGSLSVRNGNKMYVTKKNAMLGHLRQEDIAEIPLDAAGEKDEFAVHRAIYRETNFNAIIHAQPPYGIALSITMENKIMPADMKGQTVLRSVPVVRAKANSDELIKFLPPVYKSGYMISLVKEYGSFAVGANLLEALQYTTCLEGSCKILAVNKSLAAPVEKQRRPEHHERRTAIPPSIGVMGRPRGGSRGFGR